MAIPKLKKSYCRSVHDTSSPHFLDIFFDYKRGGGMGWGATAQFLHLPDFGQKKGGLSMPYYFLLKSSVVRGF